MCVPFAGLANLGGQGSEVRFLYIVGSGLVGKGLHSSHASPGLLMFWYSASKKSMQDMDPL